MSWVFNKHNLTLQTAFSTGEVLLTKGEKIDAFEARKMIFLLSIEYIFLYRTYISTYRYIYIYGVHK